MSERDAMEQRKKRCQAKSQGELHVYPCSHGRVATVSYQGRVGHVCGTHARQYAKWVAEQGQEQAERNAHRRWRWRDYNREGQQ